MKKVSLILKLISPVLLFVTGVTTTIMGFLGEIGESFYFNWTSYEYYGGDAYSGIQHAAADTANRISELCYYIFNIVEQLYILGGIIIAIVAIYWFACALASIEKNSNIAPKKIQTEKTNNDPNSNIASDILEN